MIIIDWKNINDIGQEYVDRLVQYAREHPKSYLNRKILNVIGIKTFRELILCPPKRLHEYICPQGLNPDNVYSVYDSFFGEQGSDGINNAIWLTKKLNINVCPYCNRTYTFTIKNKGVRPELDHFYPRSNVNYKHLSISFYNLVPSCPACNKIKHNQLFDFHPYCGPTKKGMGYPYFKVNENRTFDDSEENQMLFPDKPEILIENPNDNTNKLFLEQLYKHHSDYAKEILDKIIAYNSSLYDPLIKEFQGIGRTPEEIDRLIWGNYLESANQISRPLSKLTQDILKQFGIL